MDKVKYTKTQILGATKYRDNADLLNAVLKDAKEYAFDEVDRIINKYMKGSVN